MCYKTFNPPIYTYKYIYNIYIYIYKYKNTYTNTYTYNRKIIISENIIIHVTHEFI
jgi:hypothetical protein